MSNRPPVLFVATRNNLSGASRSMVDLIRQLRVRGVDVRVALHQPGVLNETFDREAIPWTPIRTHRWIGRPRGPLRRVRNRIQDVLTARRVGPTVLAQGIGLIHTNTLSSPVGALIARRTGLPHVWHMREAVDTSPGSVFLDGIDAARRLIDASARVFCVSHALAEETASYAGRDKIRVLHNGPLPAEPVPLSEREPLDPKGEIRLLMVGALGPRKGQAEALAALAILRREGLDARLQIAGNEAGPALDRLQTRARELGVVDAVDWLGYVDPAPYYRSAHVSLICGPRDPLPRTAIESLGQGIPTVALRSGGIPEIVDHDETGWLYEGPPEALAATLREAIHALPARRDEMRREGHRRAFARFNRERYGDDCLALYREMGFDA